MTDIHFGWSETRLLQICVRYKFNSSKASHTVVYIHFYIKTPIQHSQI